MPHHANQFYEFGPYIFDLSKRVLTRGCETISLTPKATEILGMLVVNAGQLVEKDELLKEVWPDTFVEESNLTQNIFTLRRALGDERAGPKYIETVARRGYRFVATVKVVKSEPNHERVNLSASQRPVVAVLPFINASGDSELEYLADGLTDNIINNLSRVSKLHVMSRSAVFRLKDVDPQQAGRDLGASAVLMGKINARASRIGINVELVDASTGWQLWGQSFDSESNDLLEIQEAITRQLLSALKLKLTGDEEKRVTGRYTENAEAYHAYLEGRYHWSHYTRKGIEKAIKHFRHAIELDPNYALAYAAIVDCYLRLATNYLLAEDLSRASITRAGTVVNGSRESDPRIRLRFEWDWKGAERELRRANELKSDYPSTPQWYSAYLFSRRLCKKSLGHDRDHFDENMDPNKWIQLSSVTLTPNEEVQVFCTIAREQIEVGNYEAGSLILSKWWTPGAWPNLENLDSPSAADLMFTAGSLASGLSSAGRLPRGQKQAEALLSGSIGIFEHLGAKRRTAEGRIELALSYYRQGMFELTRQTLFCVLEVLQPTDNDLRSLALIRLGVVERHARHLIDSLSRFTDAESIVEESGPLITGRYHHELAVTLQNLAIAETRSDYSEPVTTHLERAYYEFLAIGHHRYAAVVENSLGFLFVNLGAFEPAKAHLHRARKLFKQFDDAVRRAQVDDTLARLDIRMNCFESAKLHSEKAISALEASDEDALLAEALTTLGTILCKLNRQKEARGIFEGARRIAERCGDLEGAGRTLLVMIEELHGELANSERKDLARRLNELLEHTQEVSIRSRLGHCLHLLSAKQPY